MPREVLGLRRAVHRPARPARRQGQAREARAAGPVQDGAPPRLPRAVRGAREGETPDGDRRRGRGPLDDRDAAPKPRDDAPRHLRGPEVHPRPDADHDGFLQELGRRDREDRHRAQLFGADRLDQPDLARQLPRLHRALHKELVDYFKAKKVGVTTHICGTTYPIYEDLVNCGFTTISFDLDQQADPKLYVDQLKRFTEVSRGRAVAIGNVDATKFEKTTKEAMEADVRRCVDTAARGSAFILSTSCEIPPRSDPDAVKWFMDAAHDYGRYDRIFASAGA